MPSYRRDISDEELEPYEMPSDDPYEDIRECLAYEYQHLPPDDLEEVLQRVFGPDISPEELADSLGTVKSGLEKVGEIGKVIGKELQQAAPDIIKGAIGGAT